MYQQPWKLIPNKIRAEGGREIDRFRGLSKPQDTPDGAEAWIGSVTRANGATALNPNLGCSLVELPDGRIDYLFRVIDENPEKALGKRHLERFGTCLGILLKMLDAKAAFLLQCHPTRQVAKELWNSDYGKEECWHVLSIRDDAPQAPYIYLGFKPGVDAEAFRQAYLQNDRTALKEMCHRFEVQPGETYFVPAGMPHALGEGCFVVEIQEPSDLTAVPISQRELIRFRSRANPQGVFPPMDDALYEKRMLHSFDYTGHEAAEILKMTRSEHPVIRSGPWGREVLLIGAEHTPYFSCTMLECHTETKLTPTLDIRIGLVTEGKGELVCAEGTLPVAKGNELFFPAEAQSVTVKGQVTLVLCNPAGALDSAE